MPNHDRDSAIQSLPPKDDHQTATIEPETNSELAPPSRRKWLIPGIIVAVVLGGIGWIVFNRVILPILIFSQMKPRLMQVEMANPKNATIEDSSDYVASLQSRQSVTMQPRVSGQISAIYVKSGDRVSAGDPILQIDAAEQEAQVQSRAAAAESSAADLEVAGAEAANARNNLGSLEAQRNSRLADVQLQEKEYQRFQQLYRQGATSKQIVDQKLNALQNAQAGLQQIEANIQAQQSTILRSGANISRSQRLLQQARANISQSQVQLQYYSITAPFAGVVGDIPVKVGDFVNNTTQLLSITQNQELETQIAIPLEKATNLRKGMQVQLLDDQNQVLKTGKIFFIAPSVNPQTQSVQVKAVFDNFGGKLRANQFVRARVIWDTRPGVLVPVTAIARLGGQNFVFVATPFNSAGCDKAPSAGAPKVNPEQTVAAQKSVKLGKIIGNEQEILEGLNSDDTIVVSRLLQLQNCMAIAPEAEPAPAK